VNNGLAVANPQAASDPQASFTFEGTSLEIDFGPEDAPDSAISYSVDGGEPVTVSGHVPYTTWKGWGGIHSINITPGGPATITRYVVGDGIPLPLAMAVIGLLVVAGTAFALSRRLPA
jgi:hypothetical protein